MYEPESRYTVEFFAAGNKRCGIGYHRTAGDVAGYAHVESDRN